MLFPQKIMTDMKNLLKLLMASGVILAGMSSCDEKAALAKDVAGSWQSGETEIFNDNTGVVTGADNLTFALSEDGASGGTVTLTTNMSVERPSDPTGALGRPFSVSVAATSTIQGSWAAVDDDEIDVHLDASTLAVNVDPDAVALTMDPLAGTTVANLDSIRPQMADFVKAQLVTKMRTYYSRFARLDDVKVRDKGASLRIEAGDKEIVLRRLGM